MSAGLRERPWCGIYIVLPLDSGCSKPSEAEVQPPSLAVRVVMIMSFSHISARTVEWGLQNCCFDDFHLDQWFRMMTFQHCS